MPVYLGFLRAQESSTAHAALDHRRVASLPFSNPYCIYLIRGIRLHVQLEYFVDYKALDLLLVSFVNCGKVFNDILLCKQVLLCHREALISI